MSIVSNTFTTYSAKGIREDLSNVITNIAPEETPYQSIIIRLLPLSCRCLNCLCISGAALDDAEHSLSSEISRCHLQNAIYSM